MADPTGPGGQREQLWDRLAGGMCEALMLDLSRTTAAALFRARALDKVGRRDEAIASSSSLAASLASPAASSAAALSVASTRRKPGALSRYALAATLKSCSAAGMSPASRSQ